MATTISLQISLMIRRRGWTGVEELDPKVPKWFAAGFDDHKTSTYISPMSNEQLERVFSYTNFTSSSSD